MTTRMTAGLTVVIAAALLLTAGLGAQNRDLVHRDPPDYVPDIATAEKTRQAAQKAYSNHLARYHDLKKLIARKADNPDIPAWLWADLAKQRDAARRSADQAYRVKSAWDLVLQHHLEDADHEMLTARLKQLMGRHKSDKITRQDLPLPPP